MSTSSVCCSPQRQGLLEPLLPGKFEATAFGEEVSESPSPVSRLAPNHEHEGIEEMRRLQRRQRDELSLTTAPIRTMQYFTLAVVEQVSAACSVLSSSRAALVALLGCLWLLSLLIAVDRPQNSVVHDILAYGKFASWWVCLGIASSIGFGSGLHTFVLYLGPHVARFTLKSTACGRTDLKSAPYDTIQWGLSDSWSGQPCEQFGQPMYPHYPSEHGGYYGVPLEQVLRVLLPEAMLWGIGTAIGELPPFMVARAARISGEKARELEDLQVQLEDEHDPQQQEQQQQQQQEQQEPQQALQQVQGQHSASLFSRLRTWILSRGSKLGFLPIFFLASIPNPLFDLAGVVCGHYLVPVWKFFCATLLGKLVKGPVQAAMVAFIFSAHSVDSVESAVEHLLLLIPSPYLQTHLPLMLAALDNARMKMASGQSMPSSSGISLSAVWSAVVTLLSLSFLSTLISSTARSYLVLHHQRELDKLIYEHRQRQRVTLGMMQVQGGGPDEDDESSCVEDSAG